MAIRTFGRTSLLVLATLAAAAVAAPVQGEQPTPSTPEKAAATCVTGVPASTSPYDIDYAAVTAPAGSYDIDAGFSSSYAVGSPMDLYITSASDMGDYASFKCQYSCNGTPGCIAFFGRFVQVNSTTEHFECLSFSALLDDSAFTSTTTNIANGAFNKICS